MEEEFQCDGRVMRKWEREKQGIMKQDECKGEGMEGKWERGKRDERENEE